METIKDYCGWRYKYDGGTHGYGIEPSISMEQPMTFFKYYALTENSVNALTNVYLYASHPSQLNDPFDCNKKLVEFNSEESIRSLWENLFPNLVQQFGNDFEAQRRYTQEAYMTILYQKTGIISLTTSNKCMQMWSYYANHNGFCVELDVEKLGFSYYGPFPIHYTNDMKPFDIAEYGGHLSMLIQSNVKSEVWKYEKEWRLLAYPPAGIDLVGVGEYKELFSFPDSHNRKFAYSLSALKSITLGIRFFDGKIYTISNKECEIVYRCKDQLDYQIANFLSNPKLSHIDVYLAIPKNLFEIDTKKVSIIKINEYKFRLLEI